MTLAQDPTADDPFIVDFDSTGLKSRTLRGSAITAVAQVFKMAVQFGSTMILGRLLFPADFGLVAMVYPIISFVQLFGNLGFGEAIVQRQDLKRADVSSLFWINLAISLALALIGAVLSPVAAWLYSEPRVIPLMIAVAAILPVSALGSIHVAVLSRQMRFGTAVRNDVCATLFGIAATIGSAIAGLGYWSLVIGQMATSMVGCILAWASVGWQPSRPTFGSQVWNDIKFGANITGANIAMFITSSGDNVIIGAINGKASLGIYDRSYRLVVQPLGQMLAPISSVALPHLSRIQSNPQEYRQVYLDFVRVILLFSIPTMLVCIWNSAEIVVILLGPRWAAAAPTFAWISVGGLLSGLYSSLPWLFISQAKTSMMRRYMSVAAIFNLTSFAVGTIWGVSGVAACAALVFVLITVPMVCYGATRTGPVKLGDIFGCFMPYFGVIFIVSAIYYVTNAYWSYSNFYKLIFSAFVAYGVVGVSALMMQRERQLFIFCFDKIYKNIRRRT